jgi:hypothetical protein
MEEAICRATGRTRTEVAAAIEARLPAASLARLDAAALDDNESADLLNEIASGAASIRQWALMGRRRGRGTRVTRHPYSRLLYNI